MLSIENLVTGYDRDEILRGISFTVPERSVVTVLGHNGAGKSSLVRAIVGLLPIWKGSLKLGAHDLTRAPSPERVKAGIAVSLQDESVFPSLTVERNLMLGGWAISRDRVRLAERAEYVLEMFPRLRERLQQAAYTMSGGERRMLSIGMALMTDPDLVLLDEPSTGLSPRVTEDVMETVALIRDRLGKCVMLVEQNVEHALRVADRVIVLKTGTIVYDGSPHHLSRDTSELVMLF